MAKKAAPHRGAKGAVTRDTVKAPARPEPGGRVDPAETVYIGNHLKAEKS